MDGRDDPGLEVLPDPLDGFDHGRHVARAIELTREAGVRGDEAVAAARTCVNVARDVTRHPELTLARRSARAEDPAERARTVMYTSTEPCPMCAGGIRLAGLGAVVYGVSGARLAASRGAAPPTACAEIVDCPVVGPVRLDDAERVHADHPTA